MSSSVWCETVPSHHPARLTWKFYVPCQARHHFLRSATWLNAMVATGFSFQIDSTLRLVKDISPFIPPNGPTTSQRRYSLGYNCDREISNIETTLKPAAERPQSTTTASCDWWGMIWNYDRRMLGRIGSHAGSTWCHEKNAEERHSQRMGIVGIVPFTRKSNMFCFIPGWYSKI